MAIARVSGQTPQAAGGENVQSIAVTLPQSIVAGNAVMAVGKNRNGGTRSFSDNLSNTYVVDVSSIIDADNNVTIGSEKNITNGGSCTVTFTTTAAANRMGITAMEYSGFTGGAAFDKSASATGTGVNADSGATATTTAADELLIGGLSASALSISPTWINSFVLLAENSAGRHSAADRIVSSTGAYSAAATLGGSDNWCMVISTYKEVGGGGDPEGSLIGGKLIRGGLLRYGVLIGG